MTAREEDDWKRFIMIRGPVGERRLDEHLNWIRHSLFASHGSELKYDDVKLKYSYKDWFPKDAVDEIEEMQANMEADIAKLASKFGKR